jgi:hypothetical protein
MALGIGYGAIKTHGLKSELVSFEIPEEADGAAGAAA